MSNQIHVVRTVPAPQPDVFAAWVSPKTLVAPVTEVEMDARVGGRLRVSTGGDAAEDLHGFFLRVEPPRRLTYTWRWGGAIEETLIDVHFHLAGDRTVVAIDHRGFLDDASQATHLEGWVSYVDGLTAGL